VIVSKIMHTINTKNIMLKMHKVKGHSGDKFNDKADLLAKQA
jgi:ribonuclease HI